LMDSSASFFMPLSWKFRLPSRLSRKVSIVPWIRQIWIWIPSNLVYQWILRHHSLCLYLGNSGSLRVFPAKSPSYREYGKYEYGFLRI